MVAGALAQGASETLAAGRRVWRQAEREGVVEAPFAAAADLALHALVGPGRRLRVAPEDLATSYLSTEAISDLIAMLETDGLGYLASLAQDFDAAFLDALYDVYRQAVLDGSTKAAYVERLIDVATRWGYGGMESAPVAKVWAETAVLRPNFHQGEMTVLRVPLFRQVFPYLEYITRADEAVRENHRALHGFVARASWSGWDAEVLPPHGWNCRCRPRRVTWQEAQSFGWSGDFPVGMGRLEAFRGLGGSDAGFPRWQFVGGALAA